MVSWLTRPSTSAPVNSKMTAIWRGAAQRETLEVQCSPLLPPHPARARGAACCAWRGHGAEGGQGAGPACVCGGPAAGIWVRGNRPGTVDLSPAPRLGASRVAAQVYSGAGARPGRARLLVGGGPARAATRPHVRAAEAARRARTHHHSGLQRQRLGSDAGAERVGDVVAAGACEGNRDATTHIERENKFAAASGTANTHRSRRGTRPTSPPAGARGVARASARTAGAGAGAAAAARETATQQARARAARAPPGSRRTRPAPGSASHRKASWPLTARAGGAREQAVFVRQSAAREGRTPRIFRGMCATWWRTCARLAVVCAV